MKLAPVLISVYHRKEHFIQCINALKENELSNETELYIVSDAPYKEEHAQIIQEIRDYVLSIEGFKSVTGIFREKNLGAFNSITLAINKLLDDYEKVIFLEDDIITSRYFLKFMNEGLEIFKDRSDIFSICAYSPSAFTPLEYPNDIYTWNYYCPWGVAYWKEKYNAVDFEVKEFKKFFRKKLKVLKFFDGAQHVLPILLEDITGKIVAADAKIDFHIFNNEMRCIYPVKSLIKNIGADGSGEHTGFCNEIMSQTIDNSFNPKLKVDLIDDKKIYKIRKEMHKVDLKTRIKMYLIIIGLWNFLKKAKDFMFSREGRSEN